jgi:urease accessory protein
MRAEAKERHMAKLIFTASLTTATFMTLATAAEAHVGQGATTGLAHGFMHPLSGLDHMAAMVAVGMLAVRLGRRALWVVPALFVAFMALGGALGLEGVMMPQVEMVILLSSAVFAAMILAGPRFPQALALTLTGFLALAHGMAHGAEMPGNIGGIAYASGFLLATAFLHGAGLAIGTALKLSPAQAALDKT